MDDLKDKMKFFKLELVNRENNYNRTFTNFPNIGVLNPIENRAKS